MTSHDQASFAVHIPDAELEPEPLDPAQIVSGTPEVTGKVLWESADGKQVHGIWQITPGVVTDTVIRADACLTSDSASWRPQIRFTRSSKLSLPGGAVR